MRTSILPALQRKVHIITPTVNLPSNFNRKLNKDLPLLLGNRSRNVDKSLLRARPPHIPSDRPRVRKVINDNYCALSVAGNPMSANVSGKVTSVNSVIEELNCVPVTGKDCSVVTGNPKTRTHLPVDYHVANLVPFAGGLPQRKV